MRTKSEDTRSRILQAGQEVILNGSFGSSGINAILKSAEVPKGSFYHYFTSKDDFGVKLIERNAIVYGEALDAMMFNGAGNARQQLLEFGRAHIRFYEAGEFKITCLIVKLSAEVPSVSEQMRNALHIASEEWTAKFTKLIQIGQRDGSFHKSIDAEAIGRFLYASWLGAVTQVSITKSIVPFEAFMTSLEVLFPDEINNA